LDENNDIVVDTELDAFGAFNRPPSTDSPPPVTTPNTSKHTSLF